MFDLHKVWNALHCLTVNNSQSTCKMFPPIHQTCLALFNWGSSRKDCNPAWHQIYLAELTTASAGSSCCQIPAYETDKTTWMDFLRYKCSKFKLAIGSTNLPNVFQDFSSPSTNRTQNKIYSNVTLRYTSEPATCEYSCQGKDMHQMLYKQYKNNPWIMSTV